MQASCFKLNKRSRRSVAGLLVPARPSVRHRKPRRWRDIAILACPPPPEPFIPARSRSALAACRPSVHVSHARDRFTIRLLKDGVSMQTLRVKTSVSRPPCLGRFTSSSLAVVGSLSSAKSRLTDELLTLGTVLRAPSRIALSSADLRPVQARETRCVAKLIERRQNF